MNRRDVERRGQRGAPQESAEIPPLASVRTQTEPDRDVGVLEA